MNQEIRNKLRNVVTQCRKMLEDSVSLELEGKYGIFAKKDQVTADPNAEMTHLTDEEQAARKDVLDHFGHIKARGFKPTEALDQLVREIAFTHLNRLCAYKMMEAREVYVGGQKFREAVSRGTKSNGFLFYLGMDGHEADERLYSTGQQQVAYRHFLDWLGGLLSVEIGVLFSPNDPANRLYPRQKTLDDVLHLLNGGGIKAEETELRDQWPKIWTQDETIGWVYQYFTPKELRDQARKESQAPRNSYELAFRNQFFTPRYVVEFLTDNTLGRTWYEMRKGDTKLGNQCRYLFRRPNQIFLAEGEHPPQEAAEERDSLSQEELLKLPVHIPHRSKKDPRDLKVLDPACGSGHFLLYCFDVLLTIYEEAYLDPDLGLRLQKDYPNLQDLRQDVPRLILAHNLHGIDIDVRASQIAVLALWLRCQRAYQDMGLKKDRPTITRSNVVCAEPMPGESQMLKEFVAELQPKILRHLVEVVFDKMSLAAEAGSLLKIEEELRDAIGDLKQQWAGEYEKATDRKGQPLLFSRAEIERVSTDTLQTQLFNFSEITEEQFWNETEAHVLSALRGYAAHASNGGRLQRRLFADDAAQGFAFIDLCQKRFDVVLMNPPFGEGSVPSQQYIEDTYADTKGDVYKSFVECFQDRLIPAGFLGMISSRSGFFLGQSADWRERIVLRLFRPVVLADFGSGVLDAMVETAAYVLRNLDDVEDRQLTLRLLSDVARTETDKAGCFSIPKYQRQRSGLKRHQANGELRRLLDAGFILELPGAFRRFQANKETIAQAPLPLPTSSSLLLCIRLSKEQVKDATLLSSVRSLSTARIDKDCFFTNLSALGQIPGSTFAYWINDRVRRLFLTMAPFKSEGRHACVTNPAGNDQRYFRCWWEVPAPNIGRYIRWSPMCKGGEFRRYYSDIHLVVDWDEKDGTFRGFVGTVHRPLKRPASADYFFRPGLTYSSRTQLAFSARILPEGTIFHAKGPGVFVPAKDRYRILGLMNSKVFQALLKLQMAFGSYEVGVIQRTPIPNLAGLEGDRLGEVTLAAINLVRERDQMSETSHLFCVPALLHASGATLSDRLSQVEEGIGQAESRQDHLQAEVDSLAFQLYGFNSADQAAIEESACITIEQDSDEDSESNEDDGETVEEVGVTVPILLADMLLYSVGCIAGRWDVRFATGALPKPSLPDPFGPTPVCSPGMLTGSDGLPATALPTGFPLRMDGDGIIPDDPDHSDDIVLRVREVLELIWKDGSEAIERKACEMFCVKELRDYFRKAGKGGFWEYHIAQYSKSRRKAPIYWLLQSSKKNYGLWLYYHRLDKDTLFKARQNYVEPKIRLEGTRLDSLRAQRSALVADAKGARKCDKDIDRQEALLGELKDFADKVEQAAKLDFGRPENRNSDVMYDPDLNDGVGLNIAPLHELVPWKEAKNSWGELLKGKYEWSSIGKQLRRKGLVK